MIAALLLSAQLVSAPARPAPVAVPAGPPVVTVTAITDVRVEVGDGTVLDKATVVMSGGKIVAVGAGVTVPAGAVVVDGAGKVLSPGLVAASAQTGLAEVAMERATVDTRLNGDAVPAFLAIDGFNPQSPRIAIEREQGVTSEVLSPQGGLLYGQGFVVEMSGSAASVTTAKRAAMFGAFGGSAKDAAGGARGGVTLRLREIFDDVRFFKANRAAFDRADARPLSLSRVHLAALIDVVEGKLPLVVDVHRASDILALLAFAGEQKIKVIVDGGAEAWTVAEELARARVPVIIRPSTMEPFSFDALRARDDGPALLARAGVPLIIASEGGTTTTRTRQEAGVAVAYGLPHAAAIQAITQTPARVFGVDGEVGTVAVGKRANVVLWSGDPLEVQTTTERVWIGGADMPLATRQKDLAVRYRRR